MLVGYVSDERYAALGGVSVTFERDGERTAVESTPHGGVYADLDSGVYRATLRAEGHVEKTVEVAVGPYRSRQFRLLSTELSGYARPGWVQAGEPTELCIHAPAGAEASLHRYGGEKERVEAFEVDPVAQELPDGDFVGEGAGWAATRTVAAPERAGLHCWHLESGDETFAFPLVVAPAAPERRIAVVASTNTWNAYNTFGGRSNYLTPTGLLPHPFVGDRGGISPRERRWFFPDDEYAPLSFDRPNPGTDLPLDQALTDAYESGGQGHTAGGEWRLLGWLEREGYGHDLYADAQLHDGTLDLDAYDALLVHTHPEYWSRRMFRRVRDWVEAGGALLYLGGNGLNAAVEMLDDARMRVRNDLTNVAYDVADHGTSPPTSYESRFHRAVGPEGALLGAVYTSVDVHTAAPYEVREPDHWVFEGTGLAGGDAFGESTLHRAYGEGASGHETDKLSEHAAEDAVVLAKGRNPNDGGAELVYQTVGDGAVFTAGSITYPSALLVDEATARITKNVLDRMLA